MYLDKKISIEINIIFMRILITTGLGASDVGGPFQYGPRLQKEFQALGHEVKLVSYGKVEKFLPIGLRHKYFFFKILKKVWWADYALTLDTFSVGLPTVLACSFLNTKSIARVGGDYVWSAYVNRTGKALTLPDFYKNIPKLNLKERIIFFFTKIFIDRVDFFAFNTKWQKDIWSSYYKIQDYRSRVVRNFIPEKTSGNTPEIKNFLWAGRPIPEKNIAMLEKVAQKVTIKYPEFRLDVLSGKSHQEVLDSIKSAYACVSLAYSDICPNFILEGISYNKPFIMTKETGLNEIYPSGGLFVAPLSEDGVERAMEALMDKNEYNRLVEALKQADIRHSWQDIAEEYLEIWKHI